MNSAGRPATRWSWWHLVASVLVVSAAVLIGRPAVTAGVLSAFWFANAITIGILLLVPRSHVAGYLVIISIANLATNLALGAVPTVALGSASTNAVVVALAVVVLRRDDNWIAGHTERVLSWFRFIVGGVVIPFALGAVLQATVRQIIRGGEPQWEIISSTALTYFTTNSVAGFLLIPAILRLRPTYLRRHPGRIRRPALYGLLAVLAVLGVAVTLQSHPVLLFLLPVPLVVLAVRHGIIGATLGSVVLALVVMIVTNSGTGQFVAIANGDVGIGLLWAQVFLLLLMAAEFAMVALLAEQQPPATVDDTRASIYQLIAENAGDLISVIDVGGRVQYASPAALGALGVVPGELVGHPWQSRVHPEDLAEVESAVATLRAGAANAAFVCRMQHRDNSWRWFDVHLWLAPTPSGSDRSVVALQRDVTASRLRQQELEQQNHQLEHAAGTDELTRLPNRRRLAEVQATAWTSAVAAAEPLSLLVVDVDRFKSYNDRYGHARGDLALTTVADAITTALRRPTDFAARYGGEEFVVLLPGTESTAARQVADSICAAVVDRQIPHSDSESGLLTVSIGVATILPTREDESRLFATADAALYRAKELGRGRVEVALPPTSISDWVSGRDGAPASDLNDSATCASRRAGKGWGPHGAAHPTRP